MLFGIYTRRTGSGSHGWGGRCTRIASSALSAEVRAIRPSIPAVARPALRSVTCRTLNSAFDRLRNINFCRLRTRFRSAE